MASNFPIAPYFDDFDPGKNFRKVLFKPSFPVQARELTQLQSILQDQIKKFGDHVFKHGSVVIPGNSTTELGVPYIKCEPAPLITETSSLIGKIITNTDGVRAIIKAVTLAIGPDPLTIHLSYIGGGGASNIFQDGNVLTVLNDGRTFTAIGQNSTGLGSLASINDGVYYVNGSFVEVKHQTIVIGKYTERPSVHILLRIDEDIISSDEDATLLDPAQGTPNFAAPGADRHRMQLILTSQPIGSLITGDFIEIIRIRDGVVEEHAKTPRYSELEKSLARRTYDESGNYVVEGLEPATREHRRVGLNDGVFPDGNESLFVLEVSAGKAYIQGFEVDKISSTKLEVERGRTADHIREKQSTIRPEYGQYIFVTGIQESFSILERQQIQLWNDDNRAEIAATQIGTASVMGIDYTAGTPGPSGIYKLWVENVSIIPGHNIDEVGGVRFGIGGRASVLNEYTVPTTGGTFLAGEIINHSSGRTATVAFWYPARSTLFAFKHLHTANAPRTGDLIVGATSAVTGTITARRLLVSAGQSSMVFRLPSDSTLSLRQLSTQNFNVDYTVHKELSIATDASGNGSIVISSGTILPIEVGTFVAIGPTGILSNSLFSLNTSGNTLTITSGPINASVRAYASVRKQGVPPKTKTLASRNQIFTSPGGSVLQLDRADIVRVISVIDSVGDITVNYRMWNGQTDFSYQRGSLTLISGRPAPVGDVTVTYEFFEHSISGDFFSADSYSSIPNFLDRVLIFNSRSTGQIFNLINCVDFRPTVDENGTFIGASARRNDAVSVNTTFSTNIQYFVPRIDLLAIDQRGTLTVIRGEPADNPRAPEAPVGRFILNTLFIPPYTKRAADVVLSRQAVERFTMQDIERIVRRVERIEEFATLTADEQSILNFEVKDAVTGLPRFRTGFVVERFDRPLTLADVTNPDFAAGLDENRLGASLEVQSCELVLLNNSSHYRLRNQFITLPFTEVPFASQRMSSRVTNLNPFLVIRWEGVLNVFPSVDNWVEVQNNPTIFRDVTEQVIIQRWIPAGNPAASFTRINNPVIVSQTTWPPGTTALPPPQPAAIPPGPLPLIFVDPWAPAAFAANQAAIERHFI